MATRTVYVTDPTIWNAAAQKANIEGISLGRFVERAIARYILKLDKDCARCQRIRHIINEVEP